MEPRGRQDVPQAAGNTRGCGRKVLRENKQKKSFKKIILILVYWDLQQEVLLSSRELSLLKKTWKGNENSCSKAQEKLCTTSLGKDHAAAESSRLAGKCQAEWEWGNGISGRGPELQWKILAG